MDWKTYTEGVMSTANPALDEQGAILSATLGLVGEAAEVSEHIKKAFFHGRELDVNLIEKEIGDVLYYIAWLSRQLGIEPPVAMERNLAKLKKRHPNGFQASYNSSEENPSQG